MWCWRAWGRGDRGCFGPDTGGRSSWPRPAGGAGTSTASTTTDRPRLRRSVRRSRWWRRPVGPEAAPLGGCGSASTRRRLTDRSRRWLFAAGRRRVCTPRWSTRARTHRPHERRTTRSPLLNQRPARRGSRPARERAVSDWMRPWCWSTSAAPGDRGHPGHAAGEAVLAAHRPPAGPAAMRGSWSRGWRATTSRCCAEADRPVAASHGRDALLRRGRRPVEIAGPRLTPSGVAGIAYAPGGAVALDSCCARPVSRCTRCTAPPGGSTSTPPSATSAASAGWCWPASCAPRSGNPYHLDLA